MRRTRPIVIAGMIAVMAGLTLAAVAQNLDRVATQVAAAGTVESTRIAALPNYLSVKVIGSGRDPRLGPADAILHLRVLLGPDGQPVSSSGGIGVFTAPNGDSIFVALDGIVRPPATPGPGNFAFEGVWTVTGGKGGLARTTGSGTVLAQVSLNTGQFTSELTGTLALNGQ
jgi:hypothetical protein